MKKRRQDTDATHSDTSWLCLKMPSNARKVFSHLPMSAKAITTQRSLPCSPQDTLTFDGSQTPKQCSRLTEICPFPSLSHSFSSSSLWIILSSLKCPEHLCSFPMFRLSPTSSCSIPVFAASSNGLTGSAQCAPSECRLSVALLWRVYCFVFHSSRVSTPLPPYPRNKEMARLIYSLLWALDTQSSMMGESGYHESALEHTSAFDG